MLTNQDPLLDSLREVGFTVAQTVPRGQMLPGAGAIISLGGDSPDGMVNRGGSALFAQFVPAVNDVYPATTFAIMAKWRNLFTNGKQRRSQSESYGKYSNGMERPAWDATTAAFFPVVAGAQPVLFRVEDALDVRRALHLQKDLGFRLMLAGLKEGWDAEEVLRKIPNSPSSSRSISHKPKRRRKRRAMLIRYPAPPTLSPPHRSTFGTGPRGQKMWQWSRRC